VDGDRAFALDARLHNFQAAGKDDEKRDVGLAEVEEDFAAVDVADACASPKLRARLKSIT
jgi:hypothetical protein